VSDRKDLVRREMVAWLSPGVLWRAATEVVLSSVFAGYADKRESQVGLSDEHFRYEEAGTFWLDYASDVGDGFDSTYTIARLLATPHLHVGDERTRRGRVLVLGGDEVYPSASWEAYSERFKGPYAAALPELPDSVRPDLFAIPGNHDWYDGLTNFMRVFCQGKGIGGWRTRQRRSYFALRLPHDWWLWGIDIQFDTYIDGPQLEYFTRMAELATNGHRIILATAKPSWVAVPPDGPAPQSWQTLAYFQERVMCAHGAELALTVTGDRHHYARYEPVAGGNPTITSPKITSGGGGAYLSPTHSLPDKLRLPGVAGDRRTSYALEARWPSREESLAMRTGILAHLWPGQTPGLNLVLAAVYAVVALLLAAGLKDQATNLAGLDGRSAGSLILDALTVWVAAFAALVGLALFAWARRGDAPGRLGLLHAGWHLAVAGAFTLVLLALDPFGLAGDGFWSGYATALVVAVLATLAGRAILVSYLLGAQAIDDRWHANEVFAAQSREAGTNFKQFLRFRIDADGLTMFAIGVRQVPREWIPGLRPEFVDGLPQVELIDRVELGR
jgi:hypothetical protein